MKVLTVLLGLVALACSQKEDVETLKDQLMTAFKPELIKMEYSPDEAATVARIIVDDENAWRYLMKERSNIGSSFLSKMNLQEILEEIIPRDVDNILMNGIQTKSGKVKDEYDDFVDEDKKI